jgi:hypothetical protein
MTLGEEEHTGGDSENLCFLVGRSSSAENDDDGADVEMWGVGWSWLTGRLIGIGSDLRGPEMGG